MTTMSFEELPKNVRDFPLTDPVLAADVVDLIISLRDRHSGCIGLMLCDGDDRGVHPVIVNEVAEDASMDVLQKLLDLLLPMLAQQHGSILVGRGRRAGLRPTDTDREWHQCAIDACARHGVRLLGFHLATMDGVEALPRPLNAAS